MRLKELSTELWDTNFRFYDWEPPEDEDRVQAMLSVLLPKEALVMSHRFELDGKEFLTFSQIGELMEVGGVRAHQFLDKARRKVIGRANRAYCSWLVPPAKAQRREMARRELYQALIDARVGKDLAYIMAMRTTGPYLARTIKAAKEANLTAVNYFLAAGCYVVPRVSNCSLCDEPALYPWQFCLPHYLEHGQTKKILVALSCDNCGKRFLRRQTEIVSNLKNGSGKHYFFCSRECNNTRTLLKARGIT